jgi:hypothetical protein
VELPAGIPCHPGSYLRSGAQNGHLNAVIERTFNDVDYLLQTECLGCLGRLALLAEYQTFTHLLSP